MSKKKTATIEPPIETQPLEEQVLCVLAEIPLQMDEPPVERRGTASTMQRLTDERNAAYDLLVRFYHYHLSYTPPVAGMNALRDERDWLRDDVIAVLFGEVQA